MIGFTSVSFVIPGVQRWTFLRLRYKAKRSIVLGSLVTADAVSAGNDGTLAYRALQ